MPEDQVLTTETLAVDDSPREADFEKFAARSAPKPDSESTETKPEQDAEPGAADTSEKTKPEEKSKTAAEPGAAKPQESKKSKDKPDADERIAQLTAEIKKLDAALKAKPAVTEEKPEVKVEPPKRPNPFKWEGTPEEYETALDAWEVHQKKQAIAEFQQGQQQAAAVQQFVAKVEEARKRYPDFDAVADPVAATLLKAPLEVKSWFQKSPYWGELVYVIGSKPEFLADFMNTAQTDVHAAMRKLAFLEIEVGNELEKAAKTAKPEAEKTPVTPRAPKPPSEVGGRGTPPADELDTAVRSNDYRGAKAAMDREHFVSP